MELSDSLIGVYRLNGDMRFRCGVSSFELKSGSKVLVEQVDKRNRKVLISFGDKDSDWYYYTILQNFTKE